MTLSSLFSAATSSRTGATDCLEPQAGVILIKSFSLLPVRLTEALHVRFHNKGEKFFRHSRRACLSKEWDVKRKKKCFFKEMQEVLVYKGVGNKGSLGTDEPTQ